MARLALEHPHQPLFDRQLLPFHLAQRRVIDGQYAQFGVHALAVELAMSVIELTRMSLQASS